MVPVLALTQNVEPPFCCSRRPRQLRRQERKILGRCRSARPGPAERETWMAATPVCLFATCRVLACGVGRGSKTSRLCCMNPISSVPEVASDALPTASATTLRRQSQGLGPANVRLSPDICPRRTCLSAGPLGNSLTMPYHCPASMPRPRNEPT